MQKQRVKLTTVTHYCIQLLHPAHMRKIMKIPALCFKFFWEKLQQIYFGVPRLLRAVVFSLPPPATLHRCEPTFDLNEQQQWREQEEGTERCLHTQADYQQVVQHAVRTESNTEGAHRSQQPTGCQLFIVHVMARQGTHFTGKTLLRSLHHLKFYYGAHAIFHRHVGALEQGPVLVSIVNMVHPGSFDLQAIEQMETPGVSLFISIPGYGDGVQNFDLMVYTAERLALDLGGVVMDDQRHLLTPQKCKQCKMRIHQLLQQKNSDSATDGYGQS